MSLSNISTVDSKTESDEFDLTSILDVLIEHRLLIAAVAALFLMIGTAYAYLAAPVYETNIVVQVEDNADSAAKSLLGDLSSMFDVKSTSDSEIQILGSRLVVARAVDELRLYIVVKPKRFPIIGGWISRRESGISQPGFLGMGGYAWGAESIDVGDFDLPSNLYEKKFSLIATGGNRFALEGEGLKQPVVGKTGETVTFETSTGRASLFVRKISAQPGTTFELERYSRLQTIDDVQKRLKIASVGKDSDVITAVLQGKDPRLIADTLNEIGNQYLQQNSDRKAAQAERSLQFLAGQEPAMKSELNQAEDRFNQYRNEHGIIDLDQEAKIVLQQSADLETQLFTLRQKRQELLTRFGEEHPAVKAIDEQVNATEDQKAKIADRIKSLPLDEQGALRLERDVKVNTDLYIALRNNMEQLRLIKAGKIGNVRVVDTAYLPEIPVKPKKLLIVLVSILLGMVAGVALAWVRDTLFHGVSDPKTFETYNGLPVVATIPYSDAQAGLARKIDGLDAKSTVLATANPGDPAVESLRSLRTALQFSLLDARNNIVMISGATPGVGKSFISANLADLFAASGKRVLLIDADLRRGYLNQYFGVERKKGLSDILIGKMKFEDAALRAVRPNLDFLATGEFQSNAAELLVNDRLRRLLDEVPSYYDIVIMDAPPILAVSDAEIIAPYAGRLFLVTRSGKTRVGEIDESVKRISQGGAQVAGLLFNGMKSRGKFSYGGKYASYRYVAYDYEKREG